jgi:hypothetical protein
MRHVRIAVVALTLFGGGLAWAEEPPVASATPGPPPVEDGEVGRFIFYPARVQGGLEYLLDSTTGDLWVISRDPDTKYVYLGFIPKGPTFTFQDILRQKQLKRVPAEP